MKALKIDFSLFTFRDRDSSVSLARLKGRGWRMQDDIVAELAAIDGPINYAHLMSSEAFGAPN